jgi:tetratricopeptide (TPR) repeat protein
MAHPGNFIGTAKVVSLSLSLILYPAHPHFISVTYRFKKGGGIMKKLFSVVCLCALVSFALLIVVQTGCKSAKSDEVPITTISKEARQLFVEGRELADFSQGEKANALFKRAVELDPDFALAYLFKAGTSLDTTEFKADRAKAISLAPKVSEGEQKLIAAHQAYNDENNVVKANEIYRELAAMFPKDKRAQYYLATSYDSLQEFDKEIAALENVIALDKNYSLAYQTLGYVYRWKNQYDKAEANFKEYLRQNPKQASGYDNLADLYQKMGRFDEAIAQYRESVRIDPSLRFSEMKIGVTYAFMGKYGEARQALQALMDSETKPAFKLYDQQVIARTYIYEGDYAKALEATDKAMQMAKELGLPEDLGYGHQVKFILFFELADWDKADASLAEMLNIAETANFTPANKETYEAVVPFWGAQVAAGRKDFAAAQAKADEFKAKVVAVNNPGWQKYPGWCFGYIALAQGDAIKAIEYFSQGEMDDPFIMYYFAVAKEKAGDTAGALELYKKIATWNFDGDWYAIVRSKAAAKL